MALQFIPGPPGAGKTTHCLQEIAAHQANPALADAPIYYLVPEQFSLHSERLLLANKAANVRVQVLSFNRLAYRLFSVLGGPPGKMADELAKAMLLRKVLLENAEALQYYQSAHDKHGFVDALAQTITELNHYNVTANDLRHRVQDEPADPTLSAKLADLALIMEKYRETITGQYLLTDDMLALLAQRLEAHENALPLLDNAYVWVDGFSGFTPQERRVLVLLMKRITYMGLTLTTRNTPRFTDPLCNPPTVTQEQLTYHAIQAGVKILPPLYKTENHRHAHNPGLAFFVAFFNASARLEPPPLPQPPIELIPASNPHAVVLSAAARILQWVQKEGLYRYREIAILCGDRPRYEKILRTTFDRLNIPLFIDTETGILHHPLTELIRAALEINTRNYSCESVFRFLKTGLTPISQNDIDRLENYALAHGINHYRWQYAMQNEHAEAARAYLMETLKTLGRPNKKETVKTRSQKIFNLLYALNVPETLSRWFDTNMQNGDPETARQHKQIWPKICEIFDKLVEILGETNVTAPEFASILDAGFIRAGLGRIPPTLDEVILGDISRSRYPAIKAMLVLGANENALPLLPEPPGLFNDGERALLKNTALELAPDHIERVTEQNYALYCALSQPADKLVFLYAEGDAGGKVLRPAAAIRTIQFMYPHLTPQSTPPLQEYEPKQTSAPNTTLSAATLSTLFPPHIHTAASRLEAYARCPFAYYLTYLLKAKPRKQYEVLPTDLGNLFHAVVAQYANRHHWQTRTKAEIAEIVNDLVAEIAPESAEQTLAYHSSARNRYILEKAQRTCTASIWALTEHITQGSYTPAFSETDLPPSPPISLENGHQLSLTGRIDRADFLRTPDNETYVKIIDYKSGNTRFNPEELRNGTQLQLMLYLNAFLQDPNLTNPKPGGIFYFPISDPLLKTDILLDETQREAGLLKQYKMSGLALNDPTAIIGMDTNLQNGGESHILSARINKNGEPGKSAALAQLDYFKQLSNEANNKIKELTTRLTNGIITPAPCNQGGRKPCDYCKFGAICGYEL